MRTGWCGLLLLAAGCLLTGCLLTVEPLAEDLPRPVRNSESAADLQAFASALAAVRAAAGPDAVVVPDWRIDDQAQFSVGPDTAHPVLRCVAKLNFSGCWQLREVTLHPDRAADTGADACWQPEYFPEIDRLAGAPPADYATVMFAPRLPDDPLWHAAAAWVAEALAFGNEQRMQAVAGEGYRRDYYEFFSPRARAELGPVWIQGYGVGPTGELLFKVALQRVPPKYARVLRVAPAAAERLTLTRDWSGSLVLANEPWLLQSAVVRMQVTAQGVQLAGIDFPGGERLLVGIPGETD